MKTTLLRLSALAAALLLATNTDADNNRPPQSSLADRHPEQDFLVFPNASGMSATLSTNGPIDNTNPFFQSLGTNGRSCGSCHQPGDAWSVTPASIQRRFRATDGLDPIFRTNDGSNSPNADVSSVSARASAYGMLLTKGLIRVGIGIPEGAEFELADVDDPYGFASAAELSLFRRPLPSANLKFLNTVMWDGRETFTDSASRDCIAGTDKCFAPLAFNLLHQSNEATVGHAMASQPLTLAQRDAIVRFQMGLFTAQAFDTRAKHLDRRGADGGPRGILSQQTYFGINDVVSGDYRTGAAFDPRAFQLFDGWAGARPEKDDDDRSVMARQAVARGQALFNTKPIRITGVKGLNDDLGVAALDGTCTTCHDTPGGGNHSIPAPLDIGIADGARATPDLPLYVLRHRTTGERIATTDPGRALVTGKWKDVGRFKGPVLRSLAARPPYFHNGSAADLAAVVDFYNERFTVGLTDREKEDLAAFLRAL
jgi:hypothetical protein